MSTALNTVFKNWDLSYMKDDLEPTAKSVARRRSWTAKIASQPIYLNIEMDLSVKELSATSGTPDDLGDRLMESRREQSPNCRQSASDDDMSISNAVRFNQSPDQSPLAPRAHQVSHISCSHPNLDLALERLQISGFYYGRMSSSEARRKLTPYPAGTFLVRESSDDRYNFSLSVRSQSAADFTSTSVRIEMTRDGLFRFDADPTSTHSLPEFQCVLQLLRHHMERRHGDRHRGSRETYVFLERSGGGREQPVALRRPLYREQHPADLKHICRRLINSRLDGRSVDRLPLVPSLKTYLRQYPSDL